MSLPILQPSTTSTLQIRGDVTIDESAIIGDGVILNASTKAKIVIGAGVCLGMGTIITAYDGDIEIKENAILGSGSLIVGNCIIAAQASLGASVTVYNTNIEARSVIPAGTLIGDSSRQLDLKNDQPDNSTQFNHAQNHHKISPNFFNSQKKVGSEHQSNNSQQDVTRSSGHTQETINQIDDNLDKRNQKNNLAEEDKLSENHDKSSEPNTTEILEPDPWQEESPPNNTVVGKVYINKLLFTLFPEKNN